MHDNPTPTDNVFYPLDKGGEVFVHGRHLPHWKQASVTYFVTFRLGDSLPAGRLKAWKLEKEQWLKDHPRPWTNAENREHSRFFARVERWLDAGHGACFLAEACSQQIVASSLKHFDGDRYILDQFVVMPNHVHVLVRVQKAEDLTKVLHSWKSFTAHQLNRVLGRKGNVWQDESFDHIVRSVEQLEHFRAYIAKNPSRARLSEGFLVGTGIGLTA